ncbi:ABC transporter permease [Haloechinothrix halophila]|uniref:ABC-type antimicrobial peptide transport system, permease component n=1 Tax=Haloechinothrix halophila YIM 93223 TaxID=592678 RepID=W9DNL5_9PSEU|nr:ABC transporter permease [Haloechinothrix halophila]ETA66553.1 ABC-type antimicrobial peptide transport system, permease component [Haloechinothrix halophila YIM 93223]
MRRVSVGGAELVAPRLRLRDLARESLLSIGGQPARSLLTAIGTVLGAAAFVATLGLSSTMSQQVSSTFDLQRATEVTVRAATEAERGAAGADGNRGTVASWLREDAMRRLGTLAGVESAGRRVRLSETVINRFAEPGSVVTSAAVTGVDSGALAGIDPRVVHGRTFGAFHDRTGAPVVMLSGSVARELGVSRAGMSVFINSRAFTVVGIFDDVASRPETLLSVVMPFEAARLLTAANRGATTYDVIVKTEPGAAQQVGRQAPLVLAPHAPDSVRAIAPPDPRSLRMAIEGDVRQLSLILSVVALAIGAVSIGNAATAGIAARIPEIGLRRAMGAKRSHVFTQLLGETTLLGTLGGVIGALLGLLVTVGASLANGWQPVVDLRAALLAAAGGAVAGLLAGLVPALRAMRIPPVAALQR